MLYYIRGLLKQWVVTPNTIRYKIELRSIRHCLNKAHRSECLDGTMVDVGAGSGEMSLRLFRAGVCSRLIGVEPSDANYLALSKNFAQISGATALQASAENLPLESNSAQLVVSSQVLEHLDDDGAAAKEIARIAAPGGLVAISVPHPPEIFPDPDHLRPGYTKEQLLDLFSTYGLRFVSCDYFFTLPTLRRFVAVSEIPILKTILSVNWVDRESGLTTEEKFKLQPYGIVCLFEKIH